jgi:hypothetical protein
MPENDECRIPTKVTASVIREEAEKAGPNRYGYDPGLWPPRI